MPVPDYSQRIVVLRDALNLSQAELSRRSGTLSQSEVSHLESGRNKASSQRVRKALAKGFGLQPERLDDFLEGRVRLHDITAEAQDLPARNEDLEAVLRVLNRAWRWSEAAVAATRALHPTAVQIDPEQWVAILDAAQAALDGALQGHPVRQFRRRPGSALQQEFVAREELGGALPAVETPPSEPATAAPSTLPRRAPKVAKRRPRPLSGTPSQS